MNISKLIPYGKENAISRAELCALTGFSDRINRKYIERLRQQGERILSSSHYKGYWYSDDVVEIEEFIKEEDSRKASSNKSTDKMRRYIAEQRGIKVVPVRQHLRRVGTGDLQGQQRIEVS